MCVNYVFPGLVDESCSKNDHCQLPLKCINKTCKCPATKYHVTSRINYMYAASRCIDSSGKFPSLFLIWNNHVYSIYSMHSRLGHLR